MRSIWILNHYAGPPEITGAIRHYKFAENLIAKGYKVKVFAASSRHDAKENLIQDQSKYLLNVFDGIPFVFIRVRSYFGNSKARVLNMIEYAVRLLSVSRAFDTEKPDLIYASSVHPFTWLAGYGLAKRYKAKFIAETRDLWPETLVAMGQISKNGITAMLMYWIEKFVYKNADKLVFTFPGGKDYVESIGIDASRVRYINNGVDLKEFNINKECHVLNDSHLDDDDTFRITYTGSMGKANALNFLVESAKIIQDKGIKDIRFILFGEGYQKDELEQYVMLNGINNVFFKSSVGKKNIPYILSKSSLNVFTGQNINLYKYGLSPNKLFEYLASGKPTLSNIECGYDILKQYDCGITVKGGSAEALAEGILKFYNMPSEEYDAYCKNALKAAQDFDFEVLTQRLEQVILED